MHIPDSAIGPGTALVTGAAMLPILLAAGRRLRATLASRRVPLLALGAAFGFTLMMFNIPVPGGTTVHPTGGVLLAVLLGPWAAVAGCAAVLAIQALFFADGGVLAFGANALAMGFAMPFSGYAVYRLLAAGSGDGARRRAWAAGAGAFVGINVAALVVAVILGIQPALCHDSAGRALYFPFGLAVTIPAMMLPHLFIGGIGEAAVTAIAVRYLAAAGIPLVDSSASAARTPASERTVAWLAVALGLLILLTPLGLLASGSAWGEWGVDEIAGMAGYAPPMLADAEARGSPALAVLPDYLSERGPAAYAIAGALGAAAVLLLVFLAGRLVVKRGRPPGAAPPSARGGAPPFVHGLPDWLASSGEEGTSPPGAGGTPGRPGRRRGFLERTLAELSEAARVWLLAEAWARRDGFLQKRDPRAKILGLLGLAGVAVCLRSGAPLAALFGLALALAAASRLPLASFLTRVWLTVPLFVGAVTLPAALNVVTPGPEALVILRDPFVAITWPGLGVAGLLAFRAGVAVSFVTLLALTTRWNDLMRGLRVLLVPRPFVAILTLAYRYLGVVMHAASEMLVARRSRTVGRAAAAEGRSFLGSLAGALFGKTLVLGDEVHQAMVARGWSGEAESLRPLRIGAADVAWLGAAGIAALLAAAWELLA